MSTVFLLFFSLVTIGASTEKQLRYLPSTFASTSNQTDFNIAVVGDWSCSSNAKKTADNINDKNPELVLAAGDLGYDTQSGSCWYDIIAPFVSKTKIAIGNHDDKEAASTELKNEYLDHFNLTESYYSFNHENVHVAVMDTQASYGLNSPQYSFVKSDLQKASQDSQLDWIFVLFHKPAYSSPSHHQPQSDLRNIYHPLFDKYNVDLVIQAHNHIYDRTLPIKFNKDNPSEPIVSTTTVPSNNSSKNIGYFKDPSNPIFVVVGTGGRGLATLKGELPYVAYSDNKEYGFLNIDVNKETLTAKFYSNGDKNLIKDQFIISK